MKPVKIAAIVVVLGGGLVASYFTIKNSFPAVLPGKPESGEDSADLKAIDITAKPFQWAERVKEFIGEVKNEAGGESAGNSLVSQAPVSSPNLTRIVAQSLFGRMKNLDQGGDQPFSRFDPNDPESQAALQIAVRNLGQPDAVFNATVEDKEVKVSSDGSREAKRRYIDRINELSKARFEKISLPSSSEEVISNVSRDCFAGGGEGDSPNGKIAQAYFGVVSDFQNTAVPAEWADFHKQLIAHFKKAQAIYSSIANCYEDPIKGYLAAQSIPELVFDAEMMAEEIGRKLKEITS